MYDLHAKFIGGELLHADSAAPTFDIVNPTTETVIARVGSSTTGDVDAAVTAAREAFGSWSQTTTQERIEVLSALLGELSRRADDMARLICDEVGTPIRESIQLQVGLSQGAIADAIETLRGFDPDDFETIENSRVYKEPVGVVAAISPWNYPLFLSMTKIAPALAAGCTIVHKPSEVKPLSTLLFAQIVKDAGVPEGVYNVVVGDGPTIGEALVGHRDVDMVAFTGSTEAGKRVYALASNTVKNLNLELGGKSANLILPDADLASAVETGVRQVFFASGQACFAWSRMLVPRARLSEAEQIAKKVADSYAVGSPLEDTTTLGPIVSEIQRDRVRSYIDGAVAEGATIVTGGTQQPPTTERGYFISGTVLSNVTPLMTVAQEEVFGPVVSLMPYDTVEDAISIANGTDFGLHGAVFSADDEAATLVARRLRTGRVDINGAANNITAPFGGYRQSGIGREFGKAGFGEYLETKSIQY